MADFLLYILKMNLLAAAVILLTAVLSESMTRKYSVRWKYRIWLILAVLLLLPLHLPDRWAVVKVQIPSSFTIRTESSSPMETAELQQDVKGTTAAETGETAGVLPPSVPVSDAAGTSQTISQQVSTDSQTAEREKTAAPLVYRITVETAARVAAAVWMAGILFLGSKTVLGMHLSGRLLRRWNVANWDHYLEREYQKLCRQMKLKHAPRLMRNSMLTTPLLMGFFQPCICVPLTGYTAEEQELILRHELCHFRRKDLWYKLLLNILCAVYWFNPALWWMKKEAERDIEFLCDETVMRDRSVSDRMLYNRLLAKTAAGKTSSAGITTSFNDSLSGLKKRMVNIMRAGKLKKGTAITAFLLAFFVLCNALTGCSIQTRSPLTDDSGGTETADSGQSSQDPGGETGSDIQRKDAPVTEQEREGERLDTVPLEDPSLQDQQQNAPAGDRGGAEPSSGGIGSSMDLSGQNETDEDPDSVAASSGTPDPAQPEQISQQPADPEGNPGMPGAGTDPLPSAAPETTPPPAETPQESTPSAPEVELIDYMHSNMVQEFAEDLGMEKVPGQMFGDENGGRYENSYAGIEWTYVDESFYDWDYPERKHDFIGSVWCEENTDLSVYGVTCGMELDEVRSTLRDDGWSVHGLDQNVFLRAGNSGYNREYLQFETNGTTITEWYWCNWPEGDLE